ncbi:MAG: hypothetical protein OXF97_10590 [Nitrospira sp.]|nr:hypothetical protein [Nitrospira sp.]
MKAKIERINLTYEVEFATPSFDLPSSNVSVLKAFYETIHPRFRINTRDMHVAGGNLLSDVRVRVTLFNGNGIIDISVDRMSLAFNNLRAREDVTICRDCISLSEDALQKSLPAVSVRTVSIKPTLFLELNGEQEDDGNYLSRLPGASIHLDLSAFGNATQHSGVNLEVENSEEKWDALFHAFQDRTNTSSLILSCHVFYRADGKVRGLENRVNHLQQLLKAFLDSIGLETEGLTE